MYKPKSRLSKHARGHQTSAVTISQVLVARHVAYYLYTAMLHNICIQPCCILFIYMHVAYYLHTAMLHIICI